MSVRNYLFLCLAVVLIHRPLQAQSEARIKVVQPSVDRLKEDLKYLVELSPTPALKKQWKTLEGDLIDSFIAGLDVTKPMRLDLVFGKQEIAYEMHFPLLKLEGKDGFLENLSGLGYNSKKITTGLFNLTEGKRQIGFLREANKYASIATTKEAIPADMANPIEKLQAYLDQGLDVAAELKNDASDKKGMADRRTNFQALRKQLEAGIKFKRNEDKNEFELRKLSVEQNLNEAERFLVETELLTVTWITDIAGKKGHGNLSFSALPDTGLLKSAQLMAAKPSYFANVAKPANAAATGRINFAVDEMRAKHARDFYKTVRPVLAAQIEARPSFEEADRKTAAKQAADLLIDMLESGIELGVVDGFADLSAHDGGKHTVVGGIRAVDGKIADKILNLIPRVLTNTQVQMNVAEVGSATIHSVTIPKDQLAQFQKFFPGETQILVATSKDAVWGAIGTDAQTSLTAAINMVAGAAPEQTDSTVLTFSANTAKLVEMWDALRPETSKSDAPKTKEEQQRKKELDNLRKLATDATTGCEPIVSGLMKRNGDKIEGTLDVSECALKFVGSVIADFAKKLQ